MSSRACPASGASLPSLLRSGGVSAKPISPAVEACAPGGSDLPKNRLAEEPFSK